MKKLSLKTGLILVLLFSFSQLRADEKVTLKYNNKTEENRMGLGEFYFIHQLFADAFFMTPVGREPDTADIEKALKGIYWHLGENEPVEVTIKRKEKPDARYEFLITKDKAGGQLLVMRTNYVQKGKTYTSELGKEENFVRFYLIKGKKLVYHKDVYSKEEEEKRRQERALSVIEYYLFDDNNENDTKVPEMLKAFFDNPPKETSKAVTIDFLYNYLYKMEWEQLQRDYVSAENTLKTLWQYYESHQTDLKGYKLIVDLATMELALNKRFKK
jgi:hypothetical protein